MTVSISVSRGDNHKARTLVQNKRWIPDADDGATFTPGHWQDEGEPRELEPGQATSDCFFDDEGGVAFHIWQEAVLDCDGGAEAAGVTQAD